MFSLETALRAGLRRWSLALGGGAVAERMGGVLGPANAFGVDPFGRSEAFILDVLGPLLWLYKKYFRVEAHGLERVPAGRVLLVANHSGQLPADALMIYTAMLAECPRPRAVRGMAEKWLPSLPFVSMIVSRSGMVVGTPENCRRLLAAGEAVMAFPEGARGITKPWSQRYRLQEFGLGFMRLAMETDTPIVPVAVIGGEEQMPALADLKPLARVLGVPAAPLVLWPLPLPTRYRLYFGEPLRFTGNADDEDSEIEGKVRVVRGAIEEMIRAGLAARRHVFW